MARARARQQGRGSGGCGRLKEGFALPSGSASEPSGNLAPRLDRRGVGLPWARRHFIISLPNGKRRGGLVDRVGAYYDVEIAVRGESITTYLDGKLVNQVRDADYPHGQICLTAWHSKTRFYDPRLRLY